MPRSLRKGNPDRIQRFAKLLDKRSTMLIVMQDHPDPDAIASAVALRSLVNALAGVSCSIVHGGVVDRAENRALSKYLGLNAGAVARRIAGKQGNGGGHGALAAGQIPLTGDTSREHKDAEQRLLRIFKEAVGEQAAQPMRLVRSG